MAQGMGTPGLRLRKVDGFRRNGVSGRTLRALVSSQRRSVVP